MGTKNIVLVQFYPQIYRSVYLGIKYIPTYTARYISVSKFEYYRNEKSKLSRFR